MEWIWMLLACLVFTVQGQVNRTQHVFDWITLRNQNFSNEDRAYKYADWENELDFFKALPYLFHLDFGMDSRLEQYGNLSTKVWIDADAHLGNFGTFRNNLDNLVYDLNDFDDAVFADYQLDIWRLACSYSLAASVHGWEASVDTAIDSITLGYKHGLSRCYDNNTELTWERTQTNNNQPTSGPTYPIGNLYTKSSTIQTQKQLLDKRTYGAPRVFNLTSEVIAVSEDIKTALINGLATYGPTLTGALSYDANHFTVKDVVRRLYQGSGSIGVLRYNLLLQGPTTGEDDDIILDVKENIGSSALLNMDPALVAINNQVGTKAVLSSFGYRKMITNADNYLGYFSAMGKSFTVREISRAKNDISSNSDFNNLVKSTNNGFAMGDILANAHARGDQDTDPTNAPYNFDSIVFSKFEQDFAGFQVLVRTVASECAEQAKLDWDSFSTLLAAGAFEPTASPTKSPSISTPSVSPSASVPTKSPKVSTPTKSPRFSYPSRSPVIPRPFTSTTIAEGVSAIVGGIVGAIFAVLTIGTLLAALWSSRQAAKTENTLTTKI